MTYWHRVSSLQDLSAYLIERDVAPARLFQRHGVPASLLLRPQAWIDRDICFRLVSDMARLTSDTCLGLHLTETQQLRDFGRWGQAVLGAGQLGNALVVARNAIGLIRTGTEVTIRFEGHRVVLGAGFTGVRDQDVPHSSLACVMTLRKLVRLAGPAVPVTARLCMDGPGSGDEAGRLLGPDLEFGAERNELVFDRDALALPLASPKDPGSAARVRGVEGHSLVTARETYRHICELLESGEANVMDVAAALGLSVRRLQRHLDRWGATFETMMDEHRSTIALAELVQGRLSITDIAFRLGYSDSAHFTRAVRRWTGRPPRDIRRRPPDTPPWRLGDEPDRSAAQAWDRPS